MYRNLKRIDESSIEQTKYISAGEIVERRTVYYKPTSSLWIDIVRYHGSLLAGLYLLPIVQVSRNDAQNKVRIWLYNINAYFFNKI